MRKRKQKYQLILIKILKAFYRNWTDDLRKHNNTNYYAVEKYV